MDYLIDSSLDLEPVPGLTGLVTGWRDRKTDLVFEWETGREHVSDVVIMIFRMRSPQLPQATLVTSHLVRLEKVITTERVIRYRVSSQQIFKLIDEMQGESRQVALRIIDNLGGRNNFLQYCLSAIRACHIKYLKTQKLDGNEAKIVTYKSADKVDFDIVA